MGNQCCASEAGKTTTDQNFQPGEKGNGLKRTLQSQTKSNASSDESKKAAAALATASFQTNDSKGGSKVSSTTSATQKAVQRSSSLKRDLTIHIPQDSQNVDRNPDFKTPQEHQNRARSEYSTDGQTQRDEDSALKEPQILQQTSHEKIAAENWEKQLDLDQKEEETPLRTVIPEPSPKRSPSPQRSRSPSPQKRESPQRVPEAAPVYEAQEQMEVVADDSSDAESEMMVLKQSESMSSMGSQMQRMESNGSLSQGSSFGNLQDLNKDASSRMQAMGSAVSFNAVAERQDEEDDESVVQRLDEDDEEESVMERAEDDVTSMSDSQMQRADDDDMTSQSESLMQRMDDDGESDASAIKSQREESLATAASSHLVPKELRSLGRAQESLTSLGTQEQLNQGLQSSHIRSTANLATSAM